MDQQTLDGPVDHLVAARCGACAEGRPVAAARAHCALKRSLFQAALGPLTPAAHHAVAVCPQDFVYCFGCENASRCEGMG